MPPIIKTLVAALRQKLFVWIVEWEIYHLMFPHLEHEKDCGYPFRNDEEFHKRCVHAKLDAKLHLELIERQAQDMPKAYGEVFRYIAYRDLDRRMRMYLKLVQRRVPQAARIPKYA
jgi:hypothetical protein